MIGKWLGAFLSRPGHQIHLSGGMNAGVDLGPWLQGMPVMTRVLVIVENLPVPFDRRVSVECQALISDGHQKAIVWTGRRRSTIRSRVARTRTAP